MTKVSTTPLIIPVVLLQCCLFILDNYSEIKRLNSSNYRLYYRQLRLTTPISSHDAKARTTQRKVRKNSAGCAPFFYHRSGNRVWHIISLIREHRPQASRVLSKHTDVGLGKILHQRRTLPTSSINGSRVIHQHKVGGARYWLSHSQDYDTMPPWELLRAGCRQSN